MERLNLKRWGIKASTTKLVVKVKDMLSTDLENVSTQSVSEAKKLLAETMLTQLKAKRQQIVELDMAIADKIEGNEEFEEEIINADTYQRASSISHRVHSQGWPAATWIPASSTHQCATPDSVFTKSTPFSS